MDSDQGTDELRIILERMKDSAKKVDAFFIGTDTNVESEHPRMKLFEEAKFSLDGEKRVTSFNAGKAHQYNQVIANLKEREKPNPNALPIVQKKIDHVATKHFESVFPKRLEDLEVPVGDPRKNPSDHAPIIRNLTFQPKGKKGFFGKLF